MRALPNILTIGRIFLAGIFLILIARATGPQAPRYYYDIATVLFIVAVLTDMADGIIARRYQLVSKFGRIMDPLADKILVVGAFVFFAAWRIPQTLPPLTETQTSVVLWITAAVIALREVLMTIIRHIAEQKGYNFQATWAGKLKMVIQSITIISILIVSSSLPGEAWAQWLVATALAATIFITAFSALSVLSPSRWEIK